MEAPAQFGIYFAVLRKHLLLLGISAALVVAAGVFYVVRQRPVFHSAATLVIETPSRVLGGREYADLLATENDELSTQIFLLKQNKELARQAIDRLKEKGVDVAAGGYSEASLPASVKVEFIPGTRAVSFSLTGPHQASLPEAVNTYAQVYQEWSEGKSARVSLAAVKQYQTEYDGAESRLKDLQAAHTKRLTEHKDLNLAPGAGNPKTAECAELQRLLTTALAQNEEDVAARAAMFAALEGAGVSAARGVSGWALSAKDGAPVEPRLIEDENVVALPCVRGNEVVRDLTEAERKAADTDRRLKEDGLRAEAPDRKEAAAARDAARARRAKATARTIVTELAAQDGRMKRFEDNSARLKTLRADAAVIDEILFAHRENENLIENAKHERDKASESLRKIEGVFRSTEDPDRSVLATRRFVMVTPAAFAAQIAPNVPLVIGLTAFAAVAVGLGLVLLFEYFDDTIKSKEDFDRYIKLPFAGFIPRIDEKSAERPDTAADAKPGSAIAEAFRTVRTSILFSRSDKPVRTILVTSAGPGEGKTTVATNLAITLAKHKAPVLLIDADLRRPRVAKALGVENKTGLTNFLIGEATLDDVVRETPIEGLYVVTSGPIPPNPAELLHGDRLGELLKTGLDRFDRIVVDSPPLIAVSDARIIARCTDGLYLVISMGKTSWRLIQRSLESLTSIGFGAQGAILNNLSAPTGRYGYYYYRDYNYGKSYYVQPTAAPEK
jgi:capsular exopolysaccharide synthesis family protein